jgi:two-component system, OmpR family, phosphate regulon response regulator PhoB
MSMQAHESEPKSHHIALVEDDETLALLLKYNFEAAGLHVEWISNGAVALDRLRSDPPDIVVLDWMLPGLAGIEVLRQLRKFTPARYVPVLMMSGRGDPADRARALENGAHVLLGKPFSIQELIDRVRSLLAVAGPVKDLAVKIA